MQHCPFRPDSFGSRDKRTGTRTEIALDDTLDCKPSVVESECRVQTPELERPDMLSVSQLVGNDAKARPQKKSAYVEQEARQI